MKVLTSAARSLTGLYIGFNGKVGNEGARHLADLIATNTPLQHIGAGQVPEVLPRAPMSQPMAS